MEKQTSARDADVRPKSADLVVALIRQRLEEIADSQILLSSARRQLLVKRERVRTVSQSIQSKRLDAGDAEAIFMNQLRELINRYPEELTIALLDAYKKIGEIRDDLGEAEESYRQSEQDLTGAEWTFMDQEDRFYQYDIHTILPDEGINNSGTLYAQESNISPQLAAFHPPLHYTGSNPQTQSSTLPFPLPPPPPPPPPPSFPQSHILAAPPSFINTDLVYADTVAEIDLLKREFDQLRQKQACKVEWADGDEVLFPEGDDLPVTDLIDSINEYGDILFKISTCEAQAQRLRVERMFPDEPTLGRRYSHPTHFPGSTLASPTTMRRTQTESATLSMRNDPTVKEKIREWSLSHLTESAVQKQLYLNILEQHQIASPIEGDWKIRAAEFWSKDSPIESGDGSEHRAASANESQYEPAFRHDLSVPHSAVNSHSMQNSQGEGLCPIVRTDPDFEVRTSHGIPQEHCTAELPKTSAPSSLLQLPQAVDNMELLDGSLIEPLSKPVLDEEQHKAESGFSGHDVVKLVECTCPVETGDVALRKDSVQGTTADHHARCIKCGLEVKEHGSAQVPRSAEKSIKTLMTYKSCNLAQQNQPMDLHLPPSINSDPIQSVCIQSNNDEAVQSASPSLFAYRPAPSILDDRTEPRFIDTSAKPSSRPIVQGRKSSGSRFRSWLSAVKNKRSKSTPTIEVHISEAPVRKQPVA